jgi:hypothetical protein
MTSDRCSPSAQTAQAVLFGLPATTLALFLLFLAGMDSLSTLMFVGREMGRELNPFMQWLYERGPATFVLSKLLLTALCVEWIVRRAGHPYARVAALAGLSIYVPIVGLHILNNYATALVS